MATETKFPGTSANVSTGTENTDAWTGVGSPGNIGADDGTECTIVAASYDSPDISQRLRASNFGFSVPDGSTITNIQVEIERRSIIASSGKDFRVQLVDPSGAIYGTNKADTVTIWPTSATIASYSGAPVAFWGLGAAPSPADVRDVDWGVVLSAQANIANADIGCDFIRITITYDPPPFQAPSKQLGVDYAVERSYSW